MTGESLHLGVVKKTADKPVAKKTKAVEHSILAIDPVELTRERVATLEGELISFYDNGWRLCRIRKIKFNRKGRIRLVRAQLAGGDGIDDYYKGEKRRYTPWAFFHNHPSCGVMRGSEVVPFLLWFGQTSGEFGQGAGGMAFSARFSRRDDGGYDAAYGKGGNKLTAVIQQVEGVWTVIDGFGSGLTESSKTLKDVKADWGIKAEVSYGGKPSAPKIGPPRIGPPRIGPPKISPPCRSAHLAEGACGQGPPEGCMGDPDPEPEYDGPRCTLCGAAVHGWHNGLPPCRCGKVNTEGYTPDPLDPKMVGATTTPGEPGAITAYGALDMVYAWVRRNRDYATTEGKLDPLWETVREVLFRDLGYAEYRPDAH